MSEFVSQKSDYRLLTTCFWTIFS